MVHARVVLVPLLSVIIVVLLFAGGSRAQDAVIIGDVPLPEDIMISAPEEWAFAGAWVGRWSNGRNHILVVEGIGEDGFADVVYAVGRDQNGGGNWFRGKARIEDDALVFGDDVFGVRYSISDTGRMRGVLNENERFAILERQEISALMSSSSPDDLFLIGDLETLQTGLIEDGERVDLVVVMYRPRGQGPFPLALVHHGSTGTGTRPYAFDEVWKNDWLADVLNEHGWIVAFPQRRGRGGSGGLYDEGFAEDRSQGYSPEADLSLPGAHRALVDANAALAALRERPDVGPDGVLLSGMSRGGVVAIMQAGHNPEEFAGVINFVGGWVSEGWGDASINPTLFRRIGSFRGPVLSIYGEEDPFYSVEHSRSNVMEMEALGTKSQLHVIKLPGYGNGHWVLTMPNLWEEVVGEFLKALED
ncbi:alpha/beta hydrolase family protein [Aliiroseovarius sp. YM-037]|uniref:alpha/beta hydrolase family protein n=1 Tax=Aliiroseovarius sp. YM-037 TaxID=3341728 RepID=UPI003A7FB441